MPRKETNNSGRKTRHDSRQSECALGTARREMDKTRAAVCAHEGSSPAKASVDCATSCVDRARLATHAPTSRITPPHAHQRPVDLRATTWTRTHKSANASATPIQERSTGRIQCRKESAG